MGVKAATSSFASPLPELPIRIHQLFSEGRRDEALCEQKRLNDFMEAMPNGSSKDNFLKAADEKYILKLRPSLPT